MDYIKIYNSLIEKRKNTSVVGYCERHHIKPRCMGGDDSKENLVNLTPEEHYFAHKLLCKIYPKEYKLFYSVIRLTGKLGKRNNKLYGYFRRKYSKLLKDNKLWRKVLSLCTNQNPPVVLSLTL